MGVFSKLFGGQRSADKLQVANEVQCPHKVLTPRWEQAEDIGHEDRATGFRCESCGEMFSGDEGRALNENRTAAGSLR